MKLLKVFTTVQFGDASYKGVPFVYFESGMPFNMLNSFIRNELHLDWKKTSHTLNLKVGRIISFLNHLASNQRRWDEVTSDYVYLYVNSLETQNVLNETINFHTNAVYEFYWYCEKEKFCKGLIGINDSNTSAYMYPLNVLRSSNPSYHYKNPFQRRVSDRQLRPDITTYEQWEKAILKAYEADDEISARDAVMLEVIVSTGVRRAELLSLKTTQFVNPIEPREDCVHLRLEKTKNREFRFVKVPSEVYLTVQQFIRNDRPRLVRLKTKDNGFVFCGANSQGNKLTENYLSSLLKDKYGVLPHDGRSAFATRLLMVMISDGVSKDFALQQVRERLGHSASDDSARTLQQYYLQANELIRSQEREEKVDYKDEKIKLLLSKRFADKERIAKLQEEKDKHEKTIKKLLGRLSANKRR